MVVGKALHCYFLPSISQSCHKEDLSFRFFYRFRAFSVRHWKNPSIHIWERGELINKISGGIGGMGAEEGETGESNVFHMAIVAEAKCSVL